MALTNILDVLFSEEEQKQIEIDLKELVRARLKQPLTQTVAVEEVHVKKRRKSKWSEEARAAQAERARARFSKKENGEKPTVVLSGSEFQALRAIKTGAHWPSEVASRFGNAYPTQRAQNMLHSLASKGFLSNPREDTKAYFEITEKGLQALEENGIKEPAE